MCTHISPAQSQSVNMNHSSWALKLWNPSCTEAVEVQTHFCLPLLSQTGDLSRRTEKNPVKSYIFTPSTKFPSLFQSPSLAMKKCLSGAIPLLHGVLLVIKILVGVMHTQVRLLRITSCCQGAWHGCRDTDWRKRVWQPGMLGSKLRSQPGSSGYFT